MQALFLSCGVGLNSQKWMTVLFVPSTLQPLLNETGVFVLIPSLVVTSGIYLAQGVNKNLRFGFLNIPDLERQASSGIRSHFGAILYPRLSPHGAV